MMFLSSFPVTTGAAVVYKLKSLPMANIQAALEEISEFLMAIAAGMESKSDHLAVEDILESSMEVQESHKVIATGMTLETTLSSLADL